MGFIFKRRHFRKGRNILQGRTFWICYSRNGKKIRESSGSTKESPARKLLKLREGQCAAGVPLSQKTATVQTNELLEDVRIEWEINNRRSLDCLKRRLRLHILPFFGGKRAETINTSDMRRFALLKQEEGYANAEINRQLAVVRRAFRLAVQNGKAILAPYVPMLKESPPRCGFFEREQFQLMRSHLPEDLRPVVSFAFQTGWRKREILDLQWRNVDSQAGRVMLDAASSKNGESRTFPFTRELRELLEQQRIKTDELQKKLGTIIPWVFHRSGRRIKVLRKSFETACIKAGLPGKILHDFRRTAVRNFERSGIPRSVAMRLTGHKSESIYRRYAIVAEADLVVAVQRLDEAAQGGKQEATSTDIAG